MPGHTCIIQLAMGSASNYLDIFHGTCSHQTSRLFDCRHVGRSKSSLHEIVQSVVTSYSAGTCLHWDRVRAFRVNQGAAWPPMAVIMCGTKVQTTCSHSSSRLVRSKWAALVTTASSRSRVRLAYTCVIMSKVSNNLVRSARLSVAIKGQARSYRWAADGSIEWESYALDWPSSWTDQ